ncbi:hypothetical protein C2S53_000814 [Perilla frutescens var. hirtella]|uniref:NB-ARC domain-containing protein n=1 Tax=Perilla frutescens var. hirtella TaxID=608512 RepID=A0AAD4IPK7_PERFH|nr:hypothetical protein C2S53_000814 [Perilla frutescens var. hirtella]
MTDYYVNYFDICLDPPSLAMLQLLYKEVRSFEAFLNTSNISSRERMEDFLQELTPAMHALFQILERYYRSETSRVGNGDDLDIDRFLDLEEVVKEAFDIIPAALKMVRQEEEYYNFGGRKSKLVGLEDQYNQLKGIILVCPFVISMFGMAGNGKTTLADEIFQDFDMLKLFESRAWVKVGLSYQIEDILREILAQVLDLDNDQMLSNIGHQEVEVMLREYLKTSLEGKRYLIVLDDVWDTGFWPKLEPSLPNNDVGSKVLLTTRSREVAGFAGAIFDMRLLTKEESWDLLRERVFGEEECPPQLVRDGKKIAEHCDGLPLTIVTVANLLVDQNHERWNEIAVSKYHQLIMAAYDGILEVLYPSYWNLSPQLRFCFLYMGVFPPNYEIPLSKITSLWIAEGLLILDDDQHLLDFEDNAAEHLEDLAINSIIMVHQKSTKRAVIKRFHAQGVKTCGLHSSWRHLCHREAAKMNVFHILNSRKDGVGEEIKRQKTLSIHNNVLLGIKDVCESMVENCASTARSLLCFGPYHPYPVPICFGLESLRRLDALNIRFYEFPYQVMELVELRYLAITCNEKVPSSISKLGKLQFLIVHQHLNIRYSDAAPSYLPVEIWDLKELKYLQIMGSDLPSGNIDDNHDLLPYLSKLLHVSSYSCTRSVFEGLPNLRKLGIRIELVPDAAADECLAYFDHVSLLERLESLKCVVVNPEFTCEAVPPPALPIFPLYLKKLALNGLGCSWKDMSKIASLEYLQVLKLRCNAFRGPKWDFGKYRFVKLQYLLIEDSDDLEILKVGHESFKKLEYLSLKHCYKLEELCWESAELSVSNIELVDCSPLVEKQIKKAMLRGSKLDHNFSLNYSWSIGKLKS